MRDAFHVMPENDLVEHELSDDCVCRPDVEFVNPESGESYDEPLVIHHALDGRDLQDL